MTGAELLPLLREIERRGGPIRDKGTTPVEAVCRAWLAAHPASTTVDGSAV